MLHSVRLTTSNKELGESPVACLRVGLVASYPQMLNAVVSNFLVTQRCSFLRYVGNAVGVV